MATSPVVGQQLDRGDRAARDNHASTNATNGIELITRAIESPLPPDLAIEADAAVPERDPSVAGNYDVIEKVDVKQPTGGRRLPR
jgi:hypothetical protein